MLTFTKLGNMVSRFILHSIKTSLKWMLLVSLLMMLLMHKGYAQKNVKPQRIDSLLAVNQKYKENDSAKVILLTQIYREYMALKNVDKSEEYVNKAIQLAQKLKLNNLAGFAYYRRAKFYHGRSAINKAEENYYEAISSFSMAKNLKMIAGTYLNLGALYTSVPDYAKCLEVNQKAIAIYEQLGDEGSIASCYTNLASIYVDLGNESQSLVYLKMARKIFSTEDEKSRGVAVVDNSIGQAYFKANDEELKKMGVLPQNRLKTAMQYFQKSVKVAEILNDDNMISAAKKNIGDVYSAMGHYDLALNTYQNAIEISTALDDKSNYIDCLYALGKLYQKQDDHHNALILFNNCYNIAKETDLLEIKKDVVLGLSDSYQEIKDYNKALSFYKQYVGYKEQLFNQDKEREITRRQMQLDFSLKEKDYRYKQKITGIELQKQVLLAKQQQQQLNLRKQQLELSDKEKSLQRLTFLKKQLDLKIQQKTLTNNYDRAKLQAKYEASLRDKQISKQEQQIRIDWRIKIYLTLGIAFVVFIAGVIYFSQLRTTRLNKVINQQKKELEQLNKVKDKIFSVVSHDMRTPVNSLISFIQLLEGGKIDQDKLTRYASTLKNNLSYTSSMMENLLNWAASQMQGFNPYLENLNIFQLANEVIDAVRHHAEAKHIRIENSIAPDTWYKADANMLTLILRNLISNAIKFTERNGLITLADGGSEKELLITVADYGIGLSESQLTSFNQVGFNGAGISTPGTENEKGTGLGLILCRTFIGLMGGYLKAENNHPVGAVFSISLPK